MLKRSLLLVAAITLAFPLPASAHAAYKDSDPKANASIAQPPSQVWVEFTETVDDGTVSVFDPCGRQVDNGGSHRNLTNDRITVTMSAATAGAYRVVWKVIGSDSHPTQGEFSFTSSGGQACPDAEEEDPKEEPKETRDDQSSTSSSTSNGSTSDPETTADSGGNRSTNRAGGGSTRDEVRASENRVVDRTNRNDPIDDVAAPDPTPTADKSIWDGLPLGDFLVALAVAALIGAAGGRIYAGIIGPK